MEQKSVIELKIKSLTLVGEIQRIRHERRLARAKARMIRNKLRGKDLYNRKHPPEDLPPRDTYAAHGPYDGAFSTPMVAKLRQHETTYQSVYEHHQNVVRPMARAVHIAYCLLKGLNYNDIEVPRVDNPPNWDLVVKNLSRFNVATHANHNSLMAHISAIRERQESEWNARKKHQSTADKAKHSPRVG